jgi:ketosteroid isomerase-like protein
MRRTLLHLAVWTLTFVIGTFSSAVWGFVSPSIDKAQQARADELRLLRLEDEYLYAEMRADAQFFDRIYTSDFRLTGSDGQVLNRAEALQWVSDYDGIYREISHSDVQVRVYGDSAVVTGRWIGKGADEDGEFTDQTRWTDVFVKRDGRWLLASTQVTAIDDSEHVEE